MIKKQINKYTMCFKKHHVINPIAYKEKHRNKNNTILCMAHNILFVVERSKTTQFKEVIFGRLGL